jgi:RHS repeat-associated protein
MGSETRTYNAMGQLTNITVPGSMNITYNYSPTQNNGKITSQLDSLTGEQVTYAYDSLNRLISAQAGASWGQGFVYDPFGNLTDKNVLAGSAPPLHVVINAANNHAGGEDANGNPGGLTWDTENRLTSVPEVAPTINVHYSLSYAYDGQNKRMWANTPTVDQISGNVSDSEHYSFYGADGRLMAQFTPVYSPRMVGAPASLTWQNGPARVYFGSRMLGNEDRVGSRGKYFPYGEERNNPALPNDQVKFATYTRDAATGWDYADQRYYTAAWGRFFTPDPYGPSADARTPKSWNRYAYVLGDPINFFDPTGEKCDDDEKTTLTQEILRWIWGDPNYDTSGGLKGIIRRVNEQINGQYGPGTVEWDNHNDIITDLQDNLRKSLTKWDQDKCGPPPVSYAWKWATRGPVTEEEYRGKGKLPISETIGVANSMLNVFLSVGNQLILSVLQRFFEDFNKGLGVTTTTTSAGAVVTSTIYYAIP